jgi:hypothetical protein
MSIFALLPFFALALLGACTTAGRDEGAPQYASADPVPGAARTEQPVVRHVNDLRWLVQNSPFIFVGRLASQSFEKDGRGRVITRNRFDVERVIVGETTDRAITLTTLGGTMDGETMHVSNIPEFVTGLRYVVFTDLRRTVYNPVTGSERGVFIVDGATVYAYDGRALTGVENGLLRFSDESLRNFRTGEPFQRAAVVEEPRVTGNILSVQRAAVEPGAAMSLDEFARAIRETPRR